MTANEQETNANRLGPRSVRRANTCQMNNTQSIPAANPLLLRLVTGTAALALLAGCASTGEKVSRQSGTGSIQTLGVAVVVRNNVEVLNAAEDSTFLPALLLGSLGDEIQQGARRGRDAKTI